MLDGTPDRMPKARAAPKRLTDANARALPLVKAGAKPPQYTVRDATVAGFRVVVGTTARTWAARAEVWEGGTRREHSSTFGRVGDVPCAEARKAAAAWLGKVRAKEITPAPGRGGTTLKEALDRYVEHLSEMVEDGERSQGTVDYYREVCAGPVMRRWLDTPVAKITPAMVEARFKELRKPAPDGEGFTYFRSNQMVKALRRLWRFCKVEKRDATMPTEDPTAGRKLRKEEASQRGLAPADIAAWGSDLLKVTSIVRRCFALMTLLTGSRPGALAVARWEHLNVRERTLFVPKPKGGTRKAFHIPLTPEMFWVLLVCRTAGRVMFRRQSQTWIFPEANSYGHIRDWRAPIAHGKELRKGYRTICAHLRVDPIVSSILMNHSTAGARTPARMSTPHTCCAVRLAMPCGRRRRRCQGSSWRSCGRKQRGGARQGEGQPVYCNRAAP